MRVVVSVGGSVFVPSLDGERVGVYAKMAEQLVDQGHEVGVVVGGGSVAREYITTARELGVDEISLDELGIAVTRLNARLLVGALGETAVPEPLERFERALEAFRRGDVPVMGGTVPGHTTDAVATALAERADADLLVYATSVDGVYDADPRTDEGATKFDHLTPGQLVDIIADVELDAGSNAPVDLLAAKLLQRSGLRAVVLDGTNPARVVDAVGGEHSGTEISTDE